MTGGLIVRLIDVVLIILFGFLAISDIQVKRQIRLPEPKKEENIEEEQNTVYIFVKLSTDRIYTVVIEEEEISATADLKELRDNLLERVQILQTNDKNPVIIIDPDPYATLQATVDVYDICEQEDLPKSINMNLEESR